MIKISIPSESELVLTDLILDYNGTLAVDGHLIKGVAKCLAELSSTLKIHVVTGDTYGTAKSQLAKINCHLTIVPHENQTLAKLHYLQQLSLQATVAIGNGRNDCQILKQAAIGIAIIGDEGAAMETITSADIIVTNIFCALALLNDSRRLVATLRT